MNSKINNINQKDINIMKADSKTEINETQNPLFEELEAGTKTLSQTQEMNDSVMTSSMASLYEKLDPITKNYEALSKINATGVTSLAGLTETKGLNIIDNAKGQMQKYSREIMSLQNNTNLSGSEIKEKIEEIRNKILTIKEEASAKLEVLTLLSDSLFDVYQMVMTMKNNNLNSSEITDFIANLINGVDANCSNYSNTKTKEDMQTKMFESMNKICGKNSTEKMEEKKQTLEDKIKEFEENIKDDDLDKKEKQQTQIMIEVYSFELNIIEGILNIIKDFRPETSVS